MKRTVIITPKPIAKRWFSCMLLALALIGSAQADVLYWDSNGSTPGAGATPTGTWGTSVFWSTNSTGTSATTAYAEGSTAIFSAGTDATNAYTVTLSGSPTIAGLTVKEGTPTISGGTALTVTIASTPFTIIGNAIISSVIADGSLGYGLTKSGAGTLTLSGANTFTGNLTHEEGTLSIGTVNNSNGAGALGKNTSAVTLGSSGKTAILLVTGASHSSTKKFTLAAGGTAEINNANSLALLGLFDGDGNLAKSGAGQLTLYNNANTFSGQVVINAGILNVNTTGLIANSGTASTLGTGGGNPIIRIGSTGSATLASAYNAVASTDRQIQIGSGAANAGGATINNNNTGGGGLTFTAVNFNSPDSAATGVRPLALGGTGNNINEITGIIADNSTNGGAISLTKNTAASTWKLSGANTFSGRTTIVAGTLIVTTVNSVTQPTPAASSSLGKPSSASNGTIPIGVTTNPGQLTYAGAGDETTDRVIALAGTTGGVTLDQSGSGKLKFTSAFTTTAGGNKALTLQGSTLGGGEIGGAIVDYLPVTTTTTAATAIGGTTITVSSTTGYAVGVSISGTGIAAGATVSAVNTTTRVVTLSAAVISPGVSLGQNVSIIGTTGLAKAGSGTWTLSGVNTYSGATTISQGKLVGVTGGSASNSAASFAGTATFGVLIADNTKHWTFASLATASTPVLDFYFPNTIAPSTTVAPLVITGAAAFTSQPTVTVEGANLAVGTYPLMTWGSTSGTVPAVVTLPAGVTGYLSVTGSTLMLTITASTRQPLKWGTGSGAWDINLSSNWLDGSGNSVAYLETPCPDAVQFDDTASGASPITVTLDTPVNPASVTVNNPTKDYTISGAGRIGGGTSLTKSGAGSLTLDVGNNYLGGTTINGGAVKLGATGALAGDISVLAAGKLDVSLAPGGFVLLGGQVLSGSGAVVGKVTVAPGATLRPGLGGMDTSSTLSFSDNLTLAGTTLLAINRASTPNANKLAFASMLTNGGTLTITNVGGSLQANDSFTLFSGGTTPVGIFTATNLPALATNLTWSFINGILRVASMVNQTPTNLVAVASDGLLTLSWPTDQVGWELQGQTNALGLSTNWATVPGSTTTNQVSLPIDPANPPVFFRLRYGP